LAGEKESRHRVPEHLTDNATKFGCRKTIGEIKRKRRTGGRKKRGVNKKGKKTEEEVEDRTFRCAPRLSKKNFTSPTRRAEVGETFIVFCVGGQARKGETDRF